MLFSDVKLSRKTITYALVSIILFSLCIRLFAGYSYLHRFDLNYYILWSTGVHNGFFNAYEHIFSLDYPPMWLFPMYIVGFFTTNPEIQAAEPYFILALKIFQILFDVAIIPLIYVVLRKKNQIFALLLAATWAVNPAAIVNSSFWGQTDSVMIFLLLIAFWLLEERKMVAAMVWYCIACLTKFQCLYFAPVILLYLFFSKYDIKTIVKAICAGAATVIGVFLPFMINSGVLLPFEVYFGGHGQYKEATLNAFNLYGLFGLNRTSDVQPLFASVTLSDISWVITFLILAFVVYMFFKAPKKSAWLLCFVLMQSIFMLTSRMHERYQIPVLIFSLIAIVYYKSSRLFAVYIAQTVMVFINEGLLFLKATHGYYVPWLEQYPVLVVVLSGVNLAIYCWTMYVAIREMYDVKELNTDAVCESAV